MPICDITLFEGRTKEQKRALMREVTDAVIRAVGAKPETVRVILREIPRDAVSVAGVPEG
jgi:4-oxalocrotonate tautomerase